MRWDRFWGLIGVLRGSVDESSIGRLIAELAEYPTSEIESFDDRLHEAVHALDGPAWFDQPVTRSGSDVRRAPGVPRGAGGRRRR